MARTIVYMAPVETMGGKWAQVSRSTYKNGEDGSGVYNRFIISQSRMRIYAKGDAGRVNYFAYRSESNAHGLTAAEIATRNTFKSVAAKVRAAYADVTKYTTYMAQWKASGQKVTLRKFIWDAEAALP